MKQQRSYGKILRETAKKLWEDPAYREKMSETAKKLWEDPAQREKMSETAKKRWEDPAHREKMSELNDKREDENLTKKYGDGPKKEAAKRLKAAKKAWKSGT